MTDEQFLQRQVIELTRLRDLAGDDPILRPQLQERLDEATRDLEEALRVDGQVFPRNIAEPPRAAIFFRGGGVTGSKGIRPGLAGNALIQYEKMFTAQAIHDERQAALQAGRQRRPRGSSTPELLFTSTPRGSFGMEFVPQTTDPTALHIHGESFKRIAKAIQDVSAAPANIAEEAIRRIPSSVLQPLKQFVKVLSDYQAELRLAFVDQQQVAVTSRQLQDASERLEREVAQETIHPYGVFRGVTRETGHFDLRLDSGEVITGFVADTFSEDDLARLHELTNRRCQATIQKTIVSTVGGAWPPEYVLLSAVAAD